MGKKIRIVRNFAHYGCGFPVILDRVELLPWGDDAIILVNYSVLEAQVLRALVEKPTRLTGSEVKFIRAVAELGLASFAGLLGVTHPAVKKWEGKKDEATGMGWTTELAIRLFAMERVDISPSEFRKVYLQIACPKPEGHCELHLSLGKEGESSRYEWAPLAEAS